MQQILFGGTFDPVHHGHVSLVSLARLAFPDADILIITVCHSIYKDASTTDFSHRLAMCSHVFAAVPGIHVSDIECRPGHDGHFATTLRWLINENDGQKPMLLLGPDTFLSVTRWFESDFILQHVIPLTVIPEKNSPIFQNQCDLLQERGAAPVLLTGNLLPISSSDVRRALFKTGESSWIPDHVQRYIRMNNLYGVNNPGLTKEK